MFLLALLGILATSFFGWVVIGVSAIMLIWLVAMIHLEYSGGSGVKKVWPTIWFLAVPALYLALAAWRPTAEPGAAGFVSGLWGSLTIGHACAAIAWYLLIGLGYSLFEMRVTLWRDKKNVVKSWASYLETDVKDLVLTYVTAKMGSSAAGNEAPSAVASFSKKVEANILADAKNVETKFLTWAHMIPGKVYTLAEAFKTAVVGRTVLSDAKAEFKADVTKFETGVKAFLAEGKAVKFNPNTAYVDFEVKPDGTLDASINKGDLAICLGNWTLWWWAYLLNFVFGDMFEAIYTRLSAWIIKIYGGYVKKYFADLVAVKL